MDEVLLKQVEQVLRMRASDMKEASENLIRDEITKYPVFIISQTQVAFGEPLPDSNPATDLWHVRVVSTEMLIEKGIIPLEKAKNFVASYKSAAAFMCLLVVPEPPERPGFIFAPYHSYMSHE